MQLEQITSLTTESREDEIAAAIDLVKQFPGYNGELIQYLPLQHPVYLGRSANEVIRIRGYMFESFGHTGLPGSALPFVLEVLESERNAYLVAGAAIALRGLSGVEPEIVSCLLKASRNIKFSDDAISFESYRPRWPLQKHTTGLLEICKTLQGMGAGAFESVSDLKELCEDEYISDRIKGEIKKTIGVIEQAGNEDQGCCCRPTLASVNLGAFRTLKRLTSDVGELILEDHSGNRCKYRDYFKGKPAIVVFFYTRCDNPNKCSLTITRLGQLQKTLATEGLEKRTKIAAITYDPIYDYPFRIKSYCENRGIMFNDEHRAFRIESGMPKLLQYFNSGVNYIGSIVNHHTTELYIIDQHGNIRTHFQQLRWQTLDVIARLKECLNENACGKRNSLLTTGPTITSFASPLLSFLIVISPKCPLCLAAYFSAVGITNIHLLRASRWLLPVYLLLLCIIGFSLYREAIKGNGLLSVYLSLLGILFTASFVLLSQVKAIGYAGVVLVLMGSILGGLDRDAFAASARSGLDRLKLSLRLRA